MENPIHEKQRKRKERLDKAIEIAKTWKGTDEELARHLSIVLELNPKTIRYEYMDLIKFLREHNWQIVSIG